MNKKTLFLAALLLSATCTMQAQIEVDDDEIILTDEEGEVEEIDFPEAMDLNLDSLLGLYSSKNYLQTDNDCRMTDENPQ